MHEAMPLLTGILLKRKGSPTKTLPSNMLKTLEDMDKIYQKNHEMIKKILGFQQTTSTM